MEIMEVHMPTPWLIYSGRKARGHSSLLCGISYSLSRLAECLLSPFRRMKKARV